MFVHVSVHVCMCTICYYIGVHHVCATGILNFSKSSSVYVFKNSQNSEEFGSAEDCQNCPKYVEI